MTHCRAAAIVAVLACAACLPEHPTWDEIRYPAHPEALELDADLQATVATLMEENFGRPADPRMPDDSLFDPEGLLKGSDLYRLNCMHCHGVAGDGNGPTAPFLNPRPRNYQLGLFKFGSTANLRRPVRADLARVLEEGVAGTSMPSFKRLDAEERERLVDYVIHLSVRGETELLALGYAADEDEMDEDIFAEEAYEIVVGRWEDAEDLVVVPEDARPVEDAASAERGRELFAQNCAGCHGPTGLGDGQSGDPADFLDSWGFEARPANLQRGVYRGGRRPLDLFRRIHSGISGSPMPGFATALGTEEDVWHLVHYVRALAN